MSAERKQIRESFRKRGQQLIKTTPPPEVSPTAAPPTPPPNTDNALDAAERRLVEVLAERDEYKAEAERLRDHRDYIAGLLDEANAEIARHHADFEKWEAMANKGAARVVENERLRSAATELVAQAWHDGDGHSMKIDGDTFAHLSAALEPPQ